MDNRKIIGKKIIILVGITVVVYSAFRFLVPLVIPFLIAALLAKLIHHPVDWIHNKVRIPKALLGAFFTTMLLSVIAGAVYLGFCKFMDALPELADIWCKLQETVVGFVKSGCEAMEKLTRAEGGSYYHTLSDGFHHYRQDMASTIIPNICEKGTQMTIWILGGITIVVITVISTGFLTRDYEKIGNYCRKREWGKTFIRILHRVGAAGGAYLKAQLTLLLITAVLCVGGLYLLGMSGALWKGLLIGICDALPFLGTGTVFIPWSILTLLQGDYKLTIGFLLIYATCSLLRQIMEPKLVGDKVGVPDLVVILGIYVGIQIYGGAGIILGPLSYLLIRELYEEINETNGHIL